MMEGQVLNLKEVKRYWDERAKRFAFLSSGYVDEIWHEYEEDLRIKAVFRSVKIEPGMKVLDVGCGVGNWCFRFAKRDCSVTGVDISKEMIKLAISRNYQTTERNAYFMVMAIENLAFQENLFDLVTSITCLQHTDPSSLDKAIKDIIHVIKPGGLILILEYSPWSKRKEANSHYISPKTRNQWIQIFTNKGLMLIEEQVIFRLLGKHLYGLLGVCKLDQIGRKILPLIKTLDVITSELSPSKVICDLRVLLFMKPLNKSHYESHKQKERTR